MNKLWKILICFAVLVSAVCLFSTEASAEIKNSVFCGSNSFLLFEYPLTVAENEMIEHPPKLIILDASTYPESAHNYKNYLNEVKTFTYPGAQSLVITFNNETNTESNRDFIYIYDGTGNQITKYSGTEAANKTLTIPGDTFKVKLTSDGSTAKYGYAFSGIRANMGEVIHPPVVDPATVTCTQAGLSEGSHCKICGMVLVAQEEAAALGHDYDAAFTWNEDHTACTAVLNCSRCDDLHTLTCAITATDVTPEQTTHFATVEYENQEYNDLLTCNHALITFENWDGTQLSSAYYHIGAEVTAPTNLCKAADNTYTYAFAGWDKPVLDCDGDATYTATYTATHINYTVTFKNWDGSVISEKTYHWGDTVTAPNNPTKPADNTYTYTFAGWDSSVANCAGDAIYTATYSKLRKDGLRYSIYNGQVRITSYVGSSDVVHIPDVIDDLPVTGIGNYAFKNCTELEQINLPDSLLWIGGGAFYNCSSLANITIPSGVEFIDGNVFYGCTSLTSVVIPESICGISFGAFDDCENLNAVFYTGTSTQRAQIAIESGNEYLNWAIWHYEVTDVILNDHQTYYCKDCNRLYFTNGSEVPFQQLQIVSQPEKDRYLVGELIDLAGISLQGIYDENIAIAIEPNSLDSIHADLSTPGKKTVSISVSGASAEFEIYVHAPNTVLLDFATYPESDHIYSNNLNQIKTFTYPGAQSLIITFNGDTYTEANRDFLYIYDGAGNQIASFTGTEAAGKTLTIPGDSFKVKLTSDYSGTEYGYAFSSIQANMGDAFHPPVVDSATVTCVKAGLTEGSHCEICGDILVAQEQIDALDHNYDASFSWSESHAACTVTLTCSRNCGDVQTITCTVTNGEPHLSQTVHRAAAEYAGQEYTDVLSCGNFLITFANWDGTQISSTYYHTDDIVAVPANPTKNADNTYTYTFAGWDKEVVNCTGNAVYTATYTANYIDYTVVFADEDGTELSRELYHYGDTVTVPVNPTKAADNVYSYAFSGWDKEVVNCAGNAVYTATYEKTYIIYEVSFKNWNGDILANATYHWGDVVTVPRNPTKPADNTYTYTFKGWDKEVVNCAGTTTYTAVFEKSFIDYTVIFRYEDGTVIAEKTYHYGDQVTIPADPAAPEGFQFTGWDKEVTDCQGNATYTATFEKAYIPGDVDGNETVTDADAVYLLYYTFLPDAYPVNQDCDFNGDGVVTDQDAVYLLYYTFLPDQYPIS